MNLTEIIERLTLILDMISESKLPDEVKQSIEKDGVSLLIKMIISQELFLI